MVDRSEGYPELHAKAKTTLSKLGQLVALLVANIRTKTKSIYLLSFNPNYSLKKTKHYTFMDIK